MVLNFKRCYRIVRDGLAGFEVQYRDWWWPFWMQPGNNGYSVNTFGTQEDAMEFIERHKSLRKEVYRG